MFKYTIGVTVGDHEFFLVLYHPEPALRVFDSIAAETDNEVETDYISVAANATVSNVSLRRTYVPTPIGDPQQTTV